VQGREAGGHVIGQVCMLLPMFCCMHMFFSIDL
jgi:hypothetical protein